MQKGILKPPILSLKESHNEIMQRIDSWSVPVGVFLIGGRFRCMRRTAPKFDKYAELYKTGFVGVYDYGLDSRVLISDLKIFYKEVS